VTLPPEITDEIRARAAGLHRSFGSVLVEAGETLDVELDVLV
jgi:hypothetical protein